MIIRLNILSLVFVAALPGAVYSAGDPAPPETLAISAYEQGREQARSENWDRAAALFQSVVEKDGQDYRALNMLGYSLRQIGRLADSLAAYDRALSIKPDYAPALEYRGVTLLILSNFILPIRFLPPVIQHFMPAPIALAEKKTVPKYIDTTGNDHNKNISKTRKNMVSQPTTKITSSTLRHDRSSS